MKHFSKYICIFLIIFNPITNELLAANNNTQGSSTIKPTLKVKINSRKVDHFPDKAEEETFRFSILSMLRDVLSEKYNLVTEKSDVVDYDLIIDVIIDKPSIYSETNREDISKEKTNAIKVFVTPEAIKPDLDKYDLAIGFNFIEHPKYIRIPYYYPWWKDKINANYDRGACNSKKQFFTCFLVSRSGYKDGHLLENSDGVSARDQMFHKLSLYKFVASGGSHLNNLGQVISNRGKGTKDTIEFLSQCKFVLAYENQSFDGYITEKPFQAYFAGAIPLYYADPNVLGDINKKAVIYEGDFASQDEMVEYIKKVDQDDKLYCEIWNQKLMTDPNKDYKVIKDKLRKKFQELGI